MGRIDIIPIIETASGFSNIKEICRANKRLKRLSFGAWDFSLDTNITISKDENEIYFARSLMVVESRAAGLSGPIDTSFPGFVGLMTGLGAQFAEPGA